jgi:septum formation protein
MRSKRITARGWLGKCSPDREDGLNSSPQLPFRQDFDMVMTSTNLLTSLRRTDAPRRDTLRQQRARLAKAGEPARPRLVLASGSPRRLTLLNQVGIDPDALRPASVDETAKRGEMPRTLVNRLARAKAAAARDQIADDAELADAYILAADTVVAVGRRVLGKPRFVEEAVAAIELLSGRAHRVLTGVCLITPDDSVRTRIVDTRVRFKRLSQEEKEAYIASREWRDKAGGYAIQGLAGCFVQKIVGSYTNVVGLPLTEVGALLTGEGFPIHFGWVNAADVDAEG